MDAFYLLVAHFVSDVLLQNNWMATYKGKPWAGWKPKRPGEKATSVEFGEYYRDYMAWSEKHWDWVTGNISCTLHVAIYTAGIGMLMGSLFSSWGLVLVFLSHWTTDRFKLAERVMCATWHKPFATGPLAPWSVIWVDQIWHFVQLALIVRFL